MLIGDAGAARLAGDPVLAALANEIARIPDRSFVVFLGDNVYSASFMSADTTTYNRAVARLRVQVDATRAANNVVFVPGNHDWNGTEDHGRENVRRESKVLTSISHAQSEPQAGCPGPTVRDMGSHVRLIFLDTEWWLRGTPRPREADACPFNTPNEVVSGVRVALRNAGKRRVIVLGHHPPVSAGPHGGHFTLFDHLFPLRAANHHLWIPLPLVGSLYPLSRRLGYATQDIASARYQHLVGALREAFIENPPLLFVGGHEHQLGVFRGDVIGAQQVLVSGAGSLGRTTSAGRVPGAQFASDEAGFMRLDVLTSTQLLLRVIGVKSSGETRDLLIMRID